MLRGPLRALPSQRARAAHHACASAAGCRSDRTRLRAELTHALLRRDAKALAEKLAKKAAAGGGDAAGGGAK